MKRTVTLSFLAVFLILGILGCSDDNDKNPTGSTGGNITVTVGSGMTPEISWTGGNVYSVTISDPSIAQSDPVGSMYFSISTLNQDGIASPVTYGTVPSGAIQVANKGLVSGKKYTCSVTRTNGDNGYVQFTR